MIDRQFLATEAEKIKVLNAAPGRLFWFDIDLIELGLFNRTYGIEKGNLFLSSLENFIRSLPYVQACHDLGAGHFVFYVYNDSPITDADAAKFWKDNLRDFIHTNQKLYPEFSIRISSGICPVGPDDDLCEISENASLARKESRKSKTKYPVIYSAELLDNLHFIHKREVQIHEALIEDRFTYFLQPIVDLQSGRIVAAEALARGISTDGSIVYPDSFMQVMENNGTVIELDYLVLRKVCSDLRERMEQGKPIVCTSINLSRVHLEDSSTADNLLAIAEQYGITPDLLNFEITETLPLNEYSKAKGLVNKLRDHGFSISIDDYGSGYTGITIWQDLDFDILKMDKKFMSDDDSIKRRNTVLIPSTIELARKMDIRVICEGVERAEQCAALKNWGCDTAQGYYFSRPKPAKDFYEKFEECNGTFPIII